MDALKKHQETTSKKKKLLFSEDVSVFMVAKFKKMALKQGPVRRRFM